MTTCKVITPCGSFEASWSEDDEDQRVRYAGFYDAICFFRQYLTAQIIVGIGGKRIEFETLEPEELRGFCDSPSEGVIVEQDIDSPQDEEGGTAVLDSAYDDPRDEAERIIEALNEGRGDRTEQSDRLGFLLSQIEFDGDEDEDEFIEAAARAMEQG